MTILNIDDFTENYITLSGYLDNNTNIANQNLYLSDWVTDIYMDMHSDERYLYIKYKDNYTPYTQHILRTIYTDVTGYVNKIPYFKGSIQRISLPNTSIGGNLQSSYFSLEILDLSNTKITDSNNILDGATNLKYIDLSNNATLTGTIIFSGMTKLTNVNLHGTQLGGDFNKLTMKQLKELMASKGMKAKSNITKQELIEILSRDKPGSLYMNIETIS